MLLAIIFVQALLVGVQAAVCAYNPTPFTLGGLAFVSAMFVFTAISAARR